MPVKPSALCNQPGCGAVVNAGDRYCSAHRRSGNEQAPAYSFSRRKSQEQIEADRLRSSVRWQMFRAWFKQKYPLCCDPFGAHGKAHPAPMHDVHHVIALATDFSLAFDEANCRSICTSCHSRIEQMERAGEATSHLFQGDGKRAPIFVVYGPPGAGKTTYVNHWRRPGDLIVDQDEITHALTQLRVHDSSDALLPFVLAARRAVERRLEQTPTQRAWIIHSFMSEELRRRWQGLDATFICLTADRNTLVMRTISRPPRDWAATIDRWLSRHTDALPHPADQPPTPTYTGGHQ